PPSPNPFLPTASLAAANAPRTTAARELAYAQALYVALQDCADEMHVSHALLDGERELRPSPLIASLDAHTPPSPPCTTAPTPIRLESVIADPGPAMTRSEERRVGKEGRSRLLLNH